MRIQTLGYLKYESLGFVIYHRKKEFYLISTKSEELLKFPDSLILVFHGDEVSIKQDAQQKYFPIPDVYSGQFPANLGK